jgi:hypothetical protein
LLCQVRRHFQRRDPGFDILDLNRLRRVPDRRTEKESSSDELAGVFCTPVFTDIRVFAATVVALSRGCRGRLRFGVRAHSILAVN